jgi:hypothetical protein
MMTNSKLMLGAAALVAAFSLNAEAKLYKWVDDKGVTHYGETIPPEYANRDTKQLNKGRLTDRDEKLSTGTKGAVKKEIIEDKATIDARRRDQALLSTYADEQEIDLARDRNLLQVEARVNSYSTMLQSAQNSLTELRKESDSITKQGRKIPASLTQDIADAEALVVRREKELDTSKKDVDAVRARYEADKLRYRELKSKTPESN